MADTLPDFGSDTLPDLGGDLPDFGLPEGVIPRTRPGVRVNPVSQRFKSGADILTEIGNEPTPDITGAVASAVLPDFEPDKSLVGLDPDKVAPAKTALGVPFQAAKRVASGIGAYLTSPKGILELITTATPAKLITVSKWVYDMAAGAGQSSGNLSVLINKPDKTMGDWQKIAEDTLNTALGLFGAGHLTSATAGEAAGIRAPLTRGFEPFKERMAKDLASKLDASKMESLSPKRLPDNYPLAPLSPPPERAPAPAQPPARPLGANVGNLVERALSTMKTPGLENLPDFGTKPAEPETKPPADATPEAKPETDRQNVARTVASEIGYSISPKIDYGGVNLEGLSPEQRAQFEKALPKQWAFTKTGTDPSDPMHGRTFYVPEGATREQILGAAEAKRLETLKAERDAEPTAAAIKTQDGRITTGNSHDDIRAANPGIVGNEGFVKQKTVAGEPQMTFFDRHTAKEIWGRDHAHEFGFHASSRPPPTHKKTLADIPPLSVADDFMNQRPIPLSVAEKFNWHDTLTRGGYELRGDEYIFKEPVPVEPAKPPRTRGKPSFFIRPRPDGNVDILDHIQELGGMRPPGPNDVGGEYDGWKEAMQGTARLLSRRSARHRPDTILRDLESFGYHLQSPDELYRAITGAVGEREGLRQKGGGVQMQEQRFWDAATSPKNPQGLVKISVDDLKVGHKFRLRGPDISNDELEVTHVDADTGEVTVKDGRKLGTQTLPEGTEIWVQRKFAPEDVTPRPEIAESEEIEQPGENYQMQHRPRSDGPPSHDLLSTDLAPKDIYSRPDFYTGEPSGAGFKESVAVLRKIRGNPDAVVTIYRAAPKKTLNVGDWVSFSEAYSKQHGMADDPRSDVPVHSFKVKAKDVRWAGDTLEEFGYFPETETSMSVPKLRPGEKGTGDLLQGQEAPFNLAGEHGTDAERIARERDEAARRKAEGEAAAAKQQTGFEAMLDKAIDATNPLKPRTLEGVTGAPVWLTQTVAHAALKVVRAAYQGGKSLKAAIEDGLQWLRDQRLGGYSDEAARDWFKDTLWTEHRDDRDKLGEKVATLRGQVAAFKNKSEIPEQLKSDLKTALNDYQDAARKLRGSAGYVEDLLKRSVALVKDPNADPMEFESVKGDLEMVAPDLLDKVWTDLQARGELPKPAQLPEPISTLKQLNDWLDANKIESPKPTWRERLDLKRRAVEYIAGAGDSLRAAWINSAAWWREAVNHYLRPPVDTDFRSIIKDWNVVDERSGLETHQWAQKIRAQVPYPVRRIAMNIWNQAGGDENILRAQLEAIPDRYRAVWETALKLTPSEKALALEVRADWVRKLEDGMNIGLIEQGQENYAPQFWKVPPKPPEGMEGMPSNANPGNWAAKLDTRNPFFYYHKAFPSYFEGILSGGVPANWDISEAVARYNLAWNKSISSRGVVKALMDAKESDGMPTIIMSGRAQPTGETGPAKGYLVDARYRGKEAITADGRPYRPYDHPALRDWKFVLKTEDGKPIIAKADMLIHPDAYAKLDAILGKSKIRDYKLGRGVLKFNRFLKESKFALSAFHPATLAEESLGGLVNPITKGFKLDLSHPDQHALVRGGLSMGFDSEAMEFVEGIGSHGGLYSKLPVLGEISTELTDAVFKTYLPQLKMKNALDMLKRNRARYRGKYTEDQIAEITASQANALFGLQNYRLLGRHPFVRDLMSIITMAPDFLVSRAKTIGQALKPYGAEQRRRLLISAATLYIGARVINAALDPDNDPHWNWKDAFAVIYKNRRYSLRTVLSDVWSLMSDPRAFAFGRMSPVAGTVVEYATGRDWRGVKRDSVEQLEDLLSRAVPITAGFMVPGSKEADDGILASLGRGVGLVSKRDTPGMQVNQLAKAFNRKSSNPAAQAWQKSKDQETLPESSYRRLDDMLEANDMKAARKEYDRLLTQGHKSSAIASHYRNLRPFTGTRARDEQFIATLNEQQKKLVTRAKDEHAAQYQRFLKMAGAVTDESEVPEFEPAEK